MRHDVKDHLVGLPHAKGTQARHVVDATVNIVLDQPLITRNRVGAVFFNRIKFIRAKSIKYFLV